MKKYKKKKLKDMFYIPELDSEENITPQNSSVL